MSTSLPGSVCATLPENEKAWFFSEGGSAYKKAKAKCEGCPVKSQCLQQALDMEGQGIGVAPNGDRFGIWGGLTAAERTRLARGVA